MIKYLIVSVILTAVALVYIKVAERFNIVDKPNKRSSHIEPVIRGAGILFYLAVLMWFFSSSFQLPFLVIGLSIIAVVSYVDDIKTLSSKKRLIFQFIAILLVIFQLLTLTVFPYWVIPILLIIGVGFINTFNFMDGINGITGIYSLVILAGLYLINNTELILDERLLVFLIISILIFGFFNFRKKARFFCGDVGSISLAVVLFFLISYYTIKLESPIVVLLASIYLADAVLTIFYRKYIGENITEAHRHHIYQKFTDLKKFPHLKTAILYGAFQGLILIIILYNYRANLIQQSLIFLVIVIILIAAYVFLFKKLKKPNGAQ